MKHWTQESTADFSYHIALDFFTQLQDRLTKTPVKQKAFAERLGVSAGRISQIFNDPPSNPKLESLVKYARAFGLKVSVVAYDDGDADNSKGPVFSEIFAKCWEKLGSPRDFSAITDPIVAFDRARFTVFEPSNEKFPVRSESAFSEGRKSA
ncbi:MAG: helix-turn-helix transcriptional regulator [Terriglobales bacterium]